MRPEDRDFLLGFCAWVAVIVLAAVLLQIIIRLSETL